MSSLEKKQGRIGTLVTVRVDYVKGAWVILALFKLRIYTGAYSDPDQYGTFS